MAMLTWVGNPTGDWDDQSNWYNETDDMGDDGYPGAGDTAYFNATTVTVSGNTVANLNAFGTDILGDIPCRQRGQRDAETENQVRGCGDRSRVALTLGAKRFGG